MQRRQRASGAYLVDGAVAVCSSSSSICRPVEITIDSLKCSIRKRPVGLSAEAVERGKTLGWGDSRRDNRDRKRIRMLFSAATIHANLSCGLVKGSSVAEQQGPLGKA
jgi:hypothetical protein